MEGLSGLRDGPEMSMAAKTVTTDTNPNIY